MNNKTRNALIGLVTVLLICGGGFYLAFQSLTLATWLQDWAWLISIGVIVVLGLAGVYVVRSRAG